MTADPDFFAKSANNSSPDPHVGMPSEEAIARAINLAARAMQRQFAASGSEEEIEAAIWRHLGPAFDAVEAERTAESRNASRYADEVIQLRSNLAAAEALKAMWEDRALSAEAKLTQAVEALTAVEPYVDAIVCYASTINEHDGNRVAQLVREAASAAARGET